MRVVTAQEMREIDRAAINDYGIPGIVLMENAGLAVAETIKEMLGGKSGQVVTIFAGKGNNGGDGFVAARHLHNSGIDVKVLLLANPGEITGDAAINLNIWNKMGQKVYPVAGSDDFNAVRLFLVKTDLIVDAIYGTGFKGPVREPVGRIMEAINAGGKPVVSVDVPSGLEADTGKVNGPCVRATTTVTFALPKLGLLFEPGAGYVGELKIADISIPQVLHESQLLKRNLLERQMAANWLPYRPSASHKGDYGRVLLIAGSRGLTGAACLGAQAAARSGAGLVTLAVPEGLHGIVEAKLTEVMTAPLPQTDRQTISLEALPSISGMLDKADVLALGPGLSTHPETVELVQKLLPSLRIPCVLDADGLNALAGHTHIFKKMQAPLIITPHPGEMSRLTGMPVNKIQQDRLAVVEKFSLAWKTVVVLKGVPTLVCSPDGEVYINPTGNPGMASGGSGDVLTGIIAGLLAQGMSPLTASAAGVYLHGMAGDLAAAQKGMMGMLAGDILDVLPQAACSLEKVRAGI